MYIFKNIFFKNKKRNEDLKKDIKKIIDTSWSNYQNISKEELERETILLAQNHGFNSKDYSDCLFFLKKIYSDY
jgi:hypothetical protein